MSLSVCDHDQAFLKTIFNRPGLDKIDYRIAQYEQFRALLMKQLNHDQTLSNWTHREPDDPGIALLEGASILGDVLTFYQNLYANQAYLRTATWRDRIAELVRLTGYRLSPGVGGLAQFAFELKSNKEISIPKGFPVKIQLEDQKEISEFETISAVTAYPGLSKFNLYRPMLQPTISSSVTEFYIDQVGGTLGSRTLKADDQLLIGELETAEDGRRLVKYGQLITVDSVRDLQGKQLITMKGSLRQINGQSEVTAYKIKRTFNHSGHNAPPTKVNLPESGEWFSSEAEVPHSRPVYQDLDSDLVQPLMSSQEFPLDQMVTDLTSGQKMVVEAYYDIGVEETYDYLHVFLERDLTAVRKATVTWGGLTAPATMVTLNHELSTAASGLLDALTTGGLQVDIQTMKFYEVDGQVMTLKAAPQATAATTGDELLFYGEEEDAMRLADRTLFLQTKEGDGQTVSVSSVEADEHPFSEHTNGYRVKLNQELVLDEFDYDEPRYAVFGNLAEVNQGKTLAEVVLGNGDPRQAFQTFKLPKAPVTYLLDGSATPPEVPQVTILVDDYPWTWVPSLFTYGPNDQVYITREDEDGSSHVQFGDGETGAKPTSGVKNIKAVYRQGVGAFGAKQEGAKAQTGRRLDGLDKVHLVGSVSLGAEAEEGDHAKIAAPGKLQTLGRLVSLKDYEHEVLAMSGVAKVKAAWALENNIPLLSMWVMMASDEHEKLSDVRTLIDSYNKQRGANRYPIVVRPGIRHYIRVHVAVNVPKGVNQDAISEEIKQALGASGEDEHAEAQGQGLFDIKQRRFGQDVYANTILAVVQNVKHVNHVELHSLHTMFYWPYWYEDDSWIEDVTYIQDVVGIADSEVAGLVQDHLKIQFIEES